MGDACVMHVLYMCNACIICVYDKSIIVFLCKCVLHVNILLLNIIIVFFYIYLSSLQLIYIKPNLHLCSVTSLYNRWEFLIKLLMCYGFITYIIEHRACEPCRYDDEPAMTANHRVVY